MENPQNVSFFFTPRPPKTATGHFFQTFFKIGQTMTFQCSILYSKVNLRLLNTFLMLFWFFIHFPILYGDLKSPNTPKLAKMAHFCPYRPVRPIAVLGRFFQSRPNGPRMLSAVRRCISGTQRRYFYTLFTSDDILEPLKHLWKNLSKLIRTMKFPLYFPYWHIREKSNIFAFISKCFQEHQGL